MTDTHLRRSDYEVVPVPVAVARELVAAYHYAGGGSNTAVFRHGLFRRDNPILCLGVAWWIPPTKIAAQSVDPNWQAVISLTRLVIAPDMPTNAASFLLGQSIKLIRADGRFKTLLTYADERQGHTGAIYRATNWEYLGSVPGSAAWIDARGRQVAAKSTTTRTVAEMLELGHTRIAPSRKHKFVMRMK